VGARGSCFPTVVRRTCIGMSREHPLIRRFMRLLFSAFVATVAIACMEQSSTPRMNIAFGSSMGSPVSSFRVEPATTEAQRELHLARYSSLPMSEGMLLVYRSQSYVSIRTENLKFPVDVVFISGQGNVVEIVENAQPGSSQPIVSEGTAQFVVLLAAGAVKMAEISVGNASMFQGNFAPPE